MASTTIHVNGRALVRVAPATTGTLADFGYSRNGVDITFRTYSEGIPNDYWGGELGPPLDLQYFGETADINCTLSTYDTTVFNGIQAVLAGGTAGTAGTPGTLWFTDTKSFRVLVTSPVESTPYNFPTCVFQQPREINKGTRFSQVVMIATAYHANTSTTLYNTSTS